MSFTHQLTTNWNGGGTGVPWSGNYTADGETNRSVTLSEGAADTLVAMAFNAADLRVLEIVPSGPVIVKTNNSGSPADTLNIGSALQWAHDSGLANPISTDVTAFYLTDGLNANTAAIHAATAVLASGGPQVITSGISQPLGGLRRISATAGGTAGDIKAVAVTITGLDADGAVQTETLPAFVADTAATKDGALYFSYITSYSVPAMDGTGATVAIGVQDDTTGDVTVEVRVLHDSTP